jgi:hypothetical protein
MTDLLDIFSPELDRTLTAVAACYLACGHHTLIPARNKTGFRKVAFKDRTANGTFASISPVANSRTVGFGYPFTPSHGLTRPVTSEKGEKERAHAENPAIGANRFLIAFNAAA